jgi:hypothetical protein
MNKISAAIIFINIIFFVPSLRVNNRGKSEENYIRDPLGNIHSHRVIHLE